jgi:hypothetical protein
MLRFLLLLPKVSGRVRLLVDMSRPWSRRGTQIVSSRMFFLELCLCFPLTFLNSYDVNFVSMVIPGDELRHIGMRDGNIVVGESGRSPLALLGFPNPPPSTCLLAKVPRSLVGVDLYRAVWEAADAHLLAVY